MKEFVCSKEGTTSCLLEAGKGKFFSTWNRIRGLEHARPVLYPQSTFPALKPLLRSPTPGPVLLLCSSFCIIVVPFCFPDLCLFPFFLKICFYFVYTYECVHVCMYSAFMPGT